MFSPTSSNPSDLDGTGTINPASLNPVSVYQSHLTGGPHLAPYSPPATAPAEFDPEAKRPQALVGNESPRGVKRSRSPDQHTASIGGDELAAAASEEPVRRKRGRPPKNKTAVPPSPQLSHPVAPPIQSPTQRPVPPAQNPQTVTTPQLHNPPPPTTNTLPTPPKTTPAKTTTVKALPTVRDHTTDQLTSEGDEYTPRESDDQGEKKVMPTGHLLGGREYKCRTFHVPNRGDKLFMLATECARVLGYRDSYLLFNKNRSLYKIIATQAEKDDLIQQELLPYSYRSRQIAIVTAKSMFRQFGSRVIVDGRRVRDDYWEAKARKQGFTEDDAAGEKRPGAAKQRAAAANEQAAQAQAAAAAAANQQNQTGHTESLYTHDPAQLDQQPQPQMVQPGLGGPAPVSLAPLPMIHVMPQEDRSTKELYNVPRPRQEINGPPYQDRTQGMPMAQIMDQAHQTADFNKTLAQGRTMRKQAYNDIYTSAKKSPPPPPPQQATSPPIAHHVGPQHAPPPQHQHPQMHPPPMMSPQQLSSLNHQQHSQHQPHPQHPQQHSHQPHPPHMQQHQPLHPIMQQSPVRHPQGIKPEQLHNPAAGSYIPQSSYYQSQVQTPPAHQQHPQTPQRPMTHGQPQQMPGMHVQHPQHSPGMYPPTTPQQQYMQQPHQYPPHSQGYRPQPPPPQQQQQWPGWSGAS